MIFTVSEDYSGSRIDRFISFACGGSLPYAFVQKMFRSKDVKLNGIKAKPSDRVLAGDQVVVYAKFAQNIEKSEINQETLTKYNSMLRDMIIFENDNFFAINKPSGLAVQLGSKINICVETLIKLYDCFDCKLVHRLDKDTSGVLLVAKNIRFARLLTAMFRNNEIRKTYLAVVDGKIIKGGTIDTFIRKNMIGGEEKMVIADEGLRAITVYEPVIIEDNRTLLKLTPQTGRKHQLRVHCSEVLQAPICGDRKYNTAPKNAKDRMLLHAYKILLPSLDVEITALPPCYWPYTKFCC